jgi:hypothetical protein
MINIYHFSNIKGSNLIFFYKKTFIYLKLIHLLLILFITTHRIVIYALLNNWSITL